MWAIYLITILIPSLLVLRALDRVRLTRELAILRNAPRATMTRLTRSSGPIRHLAYRGMRS